MHPHLKAILAEFGGCIVLPSREGYIALCRKFGVSVEDGYHLVIDGLQVVWDEEFTLLRGGSR